MTASDGNFKQSFRCGLAAVLAVWLSGLAFLICCPKAVAAPSQAFCPLVKMGGHCDKARNQATLSWNSDGSGDCGVTGCAYLPIVFDKSRKVEKTKKHPTLFSPVIAGEFAPPVPAKIRSFPVFSYSRIAFDNRILVKNCILRI